MAKTTAEVIRDITINHLSSNEGLLFGQSLKGAGWLGGTIPNCDGLVDLPITDIAGPGFAVGAVERDAILTGETSFHTCLAAEADGVALFLTGHFASERFAMQELAAELANSFSELEVWASRDEKDPLQLL